MANREEQIKKLLKTPILYKLRKLYRYRSPENLELEGMFNRQEIYLPKPIDFNDPFECKPRLMFPSKLKRELLFREMVRINMPLADKKTREKLIKQGQMRFISNPELLDKVYEDFKLNRFILSI